MTVIISNAEVGGVAGCTVVVDEFRVTVLPGHHQITPDTNAPGTSNPGSDVTLLDARGGAVVPGLWDHHVHLRSLAAHTRSVDLTPAQNRAAFAAILAGAEPDDTGWIRAVGYDDDRVGELTGSDLDAFDSRGIPTRVQHRSGHQWVVNRAAQQWLATRADSESATHSDVLAAVPVLPQDGRVWGDFPFARQTVSRAARAAQFTSVVAQLVAYGVTGVTDLTHTNTAQSARELQHDVGPALSVHAFGGAAEPGLVGVKLIAHDHVFPDPDEFVCRVQGARPLPVAIHSVTAETLALLAWVLQGSGEPGDRVEHAFLAPDELRAVIAASGVSVGAHPGFLRTHGDRVAREYPPDEVASYQPLAAWQELGVPLLGGTDAPFSVVNPWVAMQAAVDRRTAAGRVLCPEWALTPEAAFALFTKAGLRDRDGAVPLPGVASGDAPFVAVLDRPWGEARAELGAVRVLGTVTNGRLSTGAE